MNRYRILTLALAIFSSAETLIAIYSSSPSGGPVQVAQGGLLNIFVAHPVQLSLFGWTCVGLSIVGTHYSHKSQIKSLFAKMGFGGDVYDLMVGMRGGGSRLALLRGMQAPKHRQELAEITGIDWKEVDRQVSVLEKYGLVKMYAQSGTVRMYQITEQGRLLLKMIEDLSAHHVW